MIELIALIVALIVVIMAWSKLSKLLDWLGTGGQKIGTVAGRGMDMAVDGMGKGVIVTRDSLLDSSFDSRKKEAKRAEEISVWEKKQTAPQKAISDPHTQWLNDIVNGK